MLIVHGDNDRRVGQRQSLRLHDALQAVGADVAFINVPGAGHGGPEFDTLHMQANILRFLDGVSAAHRHAGHP